MWHKKLAVTILIEYRNERRMDTEIFGLKTFVSRLCYFSYRYASSYSYLKDFPW